MNSYYEIEFESATASIESLSEQNKTILEQLKADEDKNFQTLSHVICICLHMCLFQFFDSLFTYFLILEPPC